MAKYNSINKSVKGIEKLKLYGRLIKQGKLLKETGAVPKNDDGDFRDQLEECLIAVCKELDIEVPIWLKKNTTEFALYRKTSFNSDHFGEAIKFDRFEIELF
jgi:hypothetical protein